MKKIVCMILLIFFFNFNSRSCDTYSEKNDKKNAEALEKVLQDSNYYDLISKNIKEKNSFKKIISESKEFCELIKYVDLKEYVLYFLNYHSNFFHENLNKKEFKIFNYVFNKRKNNIEIILDTIYELRRTKLEIALSCVGF